MPQDIHFRGITAVPSDFTAPDGDLCFSLNLISEDGALRPIARPAVVFPLDPGDSAIFIHSTPGGVKNYIIARPGAGPQDSLDILYSNSPGESKPLTHCSTLHDITAIGNTLIISSETGISYILWKDGGYSMLGSTPPRPSIRFGCYKVGTLSDSDSASIPAECNPRWSSDRPRPDRPRRSQFFQQVFALLNPIIAEKITSQGFFYQPFFVRYAYRLYDGSHSWHSAPILLMPSVLPPAIRYDDDGSHPDAGQTLKADFTLDIPYFALAYNITPDPALDLSPWADIISGIDIFISAPIYTYEQDAIPPVRCTTALSQILSSHISSVAQRPGAPDSGTPSADSPSEAFIGHYADSVSGMYIDHTSPTSLGADDCLVVNLPLNPQFHNRIRDNHLFYKIASIDFSDIKPGSPTKRLKLDSYDLTSLVARQTMPDDYQSHCRIFATSLYAFNSRLNLADVSISPATPFPLGDCTELHSINTDSTNSLSRPKITVWTRINGQNCVAVHTPDFGSLAHLYAALPAAFPRYIFYPDAGAYMMQIDDGNGNLFTVPLTSHDFLNGAFYYDDSFLAAPQLPDIDPSESPSPSISPTPVSLASKVYTSEVDNPFIFPLTGINTVGSTRVRCVRSAVQPLSQGQFGQFPLYAFTDEGIWALQTNAQGSYSAVQPVSRDVCINPAGITQIDSAVMFISARGVMAISGSHAFCISEALHDGSMFNPSGSGISFDEFFASCRIAYDYVHQRIIFFCPGIAVAMVYSLRSKLWGMIDSDFTSTVPSYPSILAMDSQSRIVDFGRDGDLPKAANIITRPFKLGSIDKLKSVTSLVCRGHFNRNHISLTLQGSRDLYTWHSLAQSRSYRLDGMCGSPYTFFRLYAHCCLSSGESITGCTLAFSTRYPAAHLR